MLPRAAAFLPSHPRILARPVRSSPVRRRARFDFSDSARRTSNWGGEMTRPGDADSIPLPSSMHRSAFWKGRSGEGSGGGATGEGEGARLSPKMEKRRCRGADVGEMSIDERGVLG